MGAGRIHITGASGSGVSTLARGLANELALQAFDTDDFFWLPTDPPCSEKRPVEERLALMESVFLPRKDWVLAGSLAGWGDPIVPQFRCVIFLHTDATTRLRRLRARERRRHGAKIAPGGPLAKAHAGFLEWAMRYDDPEFSGRSRAGHDAWLEQLPCPVLRIESSAAAPEVLGQALQALDAVQARF